MVVNDDAPVTIQDFTPGRNNGHGFDSVALGKLAVELGVTYLQVPEPRNQEQENDDRSVLKNGNPPGGEFWIVSQRLLRRCVMARLRLSRKELHGRDTGFY